MDINQDLKYAVLIDADNISYKYVKIILDEVANYGIATYRRIYGDWTESRLASWKSVLLDNSISPIQQYSYTVGKNSTDSAMIIDAMDILYSGSVNGFCIISSDSDFTRLVVRLRESGMNVIGMGESKTPRPFIAACNQFKYLDILYSNAKKAERRTRGKASAKINIGSSSAGSMGGAFAAYDREAVSGTGVVPASDNNALAVISNYAAALGKSRRSSKDRDSLLEFAREIGIRDNASRDKDARDIRASRPVNGAKDNVKELKDSVKESRDGLKKAAKGFKDTRKSKLAKEQATEAGRMSKEQAAEAGRASKEQAAETASVSKEQAADAARVFKDHMDESAMVLKDQTEDAAKTAIDQFDAMSDDLHEEEMLEPTTKLETIIEAIEAIIEEGSDEDGWLFSANLGNMLAKRFPDFDVRNYGFSKLTPFIESFGAFEVKKEPAPGNSSVQHVYVRLKPESEV